MTHHGTSIEVQIKKQFNEISMKLQSNGVALNVYGTFVKFPLNFLVVLQEIVIKVS